MEEKLDGANEGEPEYAKSPRQDEGVRADVRWEERSGDLAPECGDCDCGYDVKNDPLVGKSCMNALTRVVGVIGLFFALGSALAHPTVVNSTPKQGETLTSAPHQIRIVFSEPIEPQFTNVKVIDATGKNIGTERALPDPANAKAVVMEFPALQAGAYKVQWSALGRDGHRVKGEIAFSVK
jgi:methionine-rich copper-binding protein CopC